MADSKRDSFTKRARDAFSGGGSEDDEEVETAPAPTDAGTGAPSPDPTPKMPSLDRFLSDAQNKISEVIDAAEKVAKDTHSDARDQAAAYLQGRKKDADTLVANRREQLNEITAGLAKRVEDLRTEVDKLSREVGDSIERIKELSQSTDDPATTPAPTLSVAPEPADAEEAPGAAEPEVPAEAESAGDGDDAGSQNREHVVLRATQLAVAGTERGEIEATLVKEFGISDASSIVDEIVGPAA
jgi:cell division septum initiation protein DivIVA